MSEIYLIRHGQASFGSENYDRLSPKGVRQAAILGAHMAKLGIHFDAIYYGEMDRQQKTAKEVMDAQKAAGIAVPDPVMDPAFNEYDSEAVWTAQIGRLQEEKPDILKEIEADPGNNRAFQKVFARVVNRWVAGTHDRPGDVIWKTFKKQVTDGLVNLMKKEGSSKTIGLFSSGGPISVAVGMAFGLSDLKTIETSWHIVNASVSVLRYGGGNLTLSRFNDISHLELAGDRALLTYR